MTDDTQPDAGTIAPEETEDHEEHEAPKGVKKLLSQRNEARKEADELRAKMEELAKSVYQTEAEKQKQQERAAKMESELAELQAKVGKDDAEKVKEVIAQHPSLSVEDAYKIVNPRAFVGGETFQITGQVPQRISDPDSKPKTLEEMEAALKLAHATGNLEV